MSLIPRLLTVLLGVVLPALAQEGVPQVKAEIERLQRSLEGDLVSDQNFAPLVFDTRATLDAAKHELAAGRLYPSLEKLGRAESLLLGVRAAADKDVVKNGLPAFESRRGKANLSLSALDEQARRRDWSHSPAAIQALSEAAQGKTIPLLDGGRGFATATGPADGLFYIGQAEGEAEFAKFVAKLNVLRTEEAISLRSILPELNILQKKTNDAFHPPKSVDLHSRFIALNSTLKLAEELDERKFYAGALYEYLEGIRNYGMLDAKPLDATAQARLQADLEAAKKKLATSSIDASIAQLFVERAESYILHADRSVPSADEWRGAKVILDEVLPAFFAAGSPGNPVQAPSAGNVITVTLVRWPYT